VASEIFDHRRAQHLRVEQRALFGEGRKETGEILGRDHYPDCYTMVLAGGGIKVGLSYG
jgi:hypothetical protein